MQCIAVSALPYVHTNPIPDALNLAGDFPRRVLLHCVDCYWCASVACRLS